MVIKYIYKHPWFSETLGSLVYSEYELYSPVGEFISIHYSDPAPNLPHHIILTD